MPPEIVAAILGVAGLVIGAILQFFFTRHFERKKERRERLLSTYKEFIRSLNALASSQNQKLGIAEAQLSFETAKTQLLLDGSPKTIQRFAEWSKQHGRLDSPESCKLFSALINQLRSDCFDDDSDVAVDDIYQILFPKNQEANKPALDNP